MNRFQFKLCLPVIASIFFGFLAAKLDAQDLAGPNLIAPLNGAVLENGRVDRLDVMRWEFEWAPVSDADKYRLMVQGKSAKFPAVNTVLADTRFAKESKSYVNARLQQGWTWKVQARVNGKWGNWSEERIFDVEPLDTDLATIESPMKAVDLKVFNKSWQVDIDIQNQPAQSALKKLADEMGFNLQTRGIPKALFNKKVTLKLQRKSRLEAVEGICQQIGVYPVYDQKLNSTLLGQVFGRGESTVNEIIRFEEGPRPYSAAFAGPFLVAVSKVQENVPHATGQATLQTVATNLSSSVLSQLPPRKRGGRPVHILAMDGPHGKSLLDNEQGNSTSWSYSYFETNNFLRIDFIPLKSLLREVTSIKTISGQIKFEIPTEIKTLKFDKLAQGAIENNGKLTVTIKSLQLQDRSSSISVEVTGGPPDLELNNAMFELFDAAGKPMKNFGSSGSAYNGEVSLLVQLEGKPSSATVKVITQLAELEYDFALDGIPLREFAKMPVKIEPAKFAGHENPVTLEFLQITGTENFRKVQFKAVNHADKAVEKIDMKLTYLDAGGKILEDSQSEYQELTIFNADNRSMTRESAVAENGTKKIEVGAFDMPDNTKTVEAELTSIRFVDTEVWKTKSTR